MDKQHILAAIRRTATENGGRPLGRDRFERETGIRESGWDGKYWARWSDAVREAGLEPNSMQVAHDESFVLRRLAEFTRELGRYPVWRELKVRRQKERSFPSDGAINRLGQRAGLVKRLLEYARSDPTFADVAAICEQEASARPERNDVPAGKEPIAGVVYLLRSGRHYKIGRTNAFGRREYELAIQPPEKARTVHVVRTDDPVGIEAYWHKRFADRRGNGEWFDLTPEDVQAFKRRKFM